MGLSARMGRDLAIFLRIVLSRLSSATRAYCRLNLCSELAFCLL